MTGPLLRSVFLGHLPAACAFDPDRPGLESELDARLREGRAAWPRVELSPQDFVRHLAERTVGAELPAIERAADLYIACACARGVPLAVDAFYDAFRATIAAAAGRVDPSHAFAEDVIQAVGERIFVSSDGGRARIVDYAGRASLRGWLGAAAKRTALNLRRNKDDQAHDPISPSTEALGAGGGPEMALLKARYKHELEAAIRASMGRLPARDRSLLLLHLVEGLTLPQIGAMHRVSRATIQRWLASARAALHEETRRDLVNRLRLSPSEYESVVALVRSQLDLSLAGALHAGPTEA